MRAATCAWLLPGLLVSCVNVVVPDDEDPPEEPSCTSVAAKVWLTSEGGELGMMSAFPGPDCSTVVAGGFYGDAVVAGVPLGASVDWDGFIARVNPDGSARWTLRLTGGEPGNWIDHVNAVVAAPDGTVWASGYWAEDMTEGTHTVDEGNFVMALDGDGEIQWLSRFESPVRHIALREDKIVALTDTAERIEWWNLDKTTGETVAVHSIAWGRVPLLAATTRGDRTAIAVCFSRESFVGFERLVAADDALDGDANETCDLALAMFDHEGLPLYVRTFTEHGFAPSDADLAINEIGDVALNASFSGRVEMGDDLDVRAIGSGMSELVATFDPEGHTISAAAHGDARHMSPNGVLWRDNETVTLAATLRQGGADLGGTPIGPAEDQLGFEATFTAGGEHLQSAAREGVLHLLPAEPGAALWIDRQPYEPERTTVAVSRSEL